MNGDLLSTTDYNDMKTEEILIPYKEDEVCCVCLENTTDNTTCNHYICFKCRDRCIIQQRRDCPMCRQTNVLSTYSNTVNLINNVDYTELNELFHRSLYNKRHVSLDDSSSSSSSDDDDDDDDESESDDDNSLRQEELRQEEVRQEELRQEELIRRVRQEELREVGLYSDSDSDCE